MPEVSPTEKKRDQRMGTGRLWKILFHPQKWKYTKDRHDRISKKTCFTHRDRNILENGLG